VKPYRFVARNPPIDITIPPGDGPAYPTGGIGGYKTIPLQDQVEGVDWEGQPPLTEDVPLLLDGLAARESVEREWNTVKKLGRDPNGDEERPPAFQVYGPLDAPEGKWWCLPANGIEINTEEMIKRDGDGELLRIEFTMHLLEFIPPEVIKARHAKAKKAVGSISNAVVVGGTYTVKQGDTLISIANKLYNGEWERWQEIGKKNNLFDPLVPLKPGRVLQL
jgi:hypothetical protein